MMQSDEIIKLAEIFVSLGVKKIRLTGGEPLLRRMQLKYHIPVKIPD